MSDEETIVVPQGPAAKGGLMFNVTLEPLNGSFESTTVNVTTPVKLGRVGGIPAGTPAVTFKSKVVSRQHAELFIQDGRLLVKDLGSASGTFVNNVKLAANGQMELRNEDRLQLGNNYTEDRAQLKAEPDLLCVSMKVLIRPAGTLAAGSELSHLTALVGSIAISTSPVPGLDRKGSGAGLGTPTRADSPLRTMSSDGLQRSSSVQLLSQDPPKDPKLREPFAVTVQRDKFILTRVAVQQGGKDVFLVNLKAWITSRKLLVQDVRISATVASMEIAVDPNSKDMSKYNIHNSATGAVLASLDKKGARSAFIELADKSRRFHASGDFDASFVLKNAISTYEVGDVVEVETTKKGSSYLRNVTVNLDKEPWSSIVLACVMSLIILVD